MTRYHTLDTTLEIGARKYMKGHEINVVYVFIANRINPVRGNVYIRKAVRKFVKAVR